MDRRLLQVSTIAAVIVAVPAAATAQTRTYRFDQPSMSMDAALTQLAETAGRDILFSAGATAGRRAPAIRGQMTLDTALVLALAGADLHADLTGSAVVIERGAPAAASLATVVEEVVVTGNRARARSVEDSPAPVDVLGRDDIGSTGFVDTTDVLRMLIPSFTVGRNPNSDAGTFVRPASLRGLPGDKTLLLVNSKRRHRSAAVSASGFGSQAADSATIPASAIRTIEVLRDGAAAQYGSDAVAGVINFLLKEDDHGGSLTARVGQYYEGDGQDYFLAGNIGLPLTENGFINISAEYNKAEQTSRGGPYCSAAFCAADYAAENPEYAALVDPTQPLSMIGQPSLEAVRGFVNAGIDLDDDTRIYAFGNFSRSNSVADAIYRYPTNDQTTLDVPVRLPDGSVFSFNEIFPGGFTPKYSAIITDYSLVAGWRGRTVAGLGFDLSARFGADRMKYKTENALNPSLGPASPRAFTRANYVAEEWALNADFTRDFVLPLTDRSANAAFGLEYRNESFEPQPGQASAYAAGPYARSDPWGFCAEGATAPIGVDCADPDDPVYNTLPAMTLTVSPAQAGRLDRRSLAAYSELSFEVTEALLFDAALRYEDFSDFGDTLNGKLAARYVVTQGLTLRGSIGTGFRAPTPGQQSFSNTQFNTVDGAIQVTGLFPAGSPVSRFLGAQPLKPETAFNLSAGLVARLGRDTSLSVDVYRIAIKDQYYRTSSIAVTPAIRQAMSDAGVVGAESVSSVQFFQNALDATVTGVDVVATHALEWGGGQSTRFTFNANANRYEVDRVNIVGLLDREEVFDFENGLPAWRGALQVEHEVGRWRLTARGTLWGGYENMFSAADPRIQTFDPEFMMDVEAGYRIREGLNLSIGARNLFNAYPALDRIGEGTANGALYRADSVVDWQGGFWFVRLEARF
ncbi:TonB-dependent receptor domain-containing protein [Brevundimonas sp.]|uniref:TonB-dependent receptor domain-containing protein n=1 Tax=Brevundimonas sp. TaxID=1871086 RepID=UPI0037C0DA7A